MEYGHRIGVMTRGGSQPKTQTRSSIRKARTTRDLRRCAELGKMTRLKDNTLIELTGRGAIFKEKKEKKAGGSEQLSLAIAKRRWLGKGSYSD